MEKVWVDFAAIWGAALATILGILQFWQHVQNRPVIRLEADFIFSSTDEHSETKGTKILNPKAGWQEILLRLTAANHGRQSLQITAVVLEEESTGNVTQVFPERLPAVLDPNTSVTVHIQKEWLDGTPITLLGVVDALGRKHAIGKSELESLLSRSAELPSDKRLYARKDNPEEKVLAFQARDKCLITNRKTMIKSGRA